MKVKDLTICAACLAVLVICSKISLNIGIIALTLQTFAVSIIGFILKWKKATLVFLTYIVMGLIGIPVFSTGGGYMYVVSPSFGFIIGFLLSGFITGSTFLSDKKWMLIVKGLLGLVIIDVVGLAYMYVILKFYLVSPNANFVYVLQAGFIPFIAKDSVSVVLSAVIAMRLVPAIEGIGVYNNKQIIETK